MAVTIDWGLAKPAPDYATSFANAFKVGQQLGASDVQARALNAFGENNAAPLDPRLAAANPDLYGALQDRQRAAADRQSSVDQATAMGNGDMTGAVSAAAARGATGDVSTLTAQQAAAQAQLADAFGGAVHGLLLQPPADRLAHAQAIIANSPAAAAILQHAGIDPAHLTPDDVSDASLTQLLQGLQGLKADLAGDKPTVVAKDSSLLFGPGALGGGAPPPAAANPPAPAAPATASITPSATAAGGVPGMITAAATKYGVDPGLALSIAHAESNFNQAAKSPKGAIGVMQLMPPTAAALGVDPTDLAGNIDGGVRYLAQLNRQFGGDPRLVAAAYNAGPDAVHAAGGVPNYPETRNYVARVTGGATLAAAPTAPPAPSGPSTTRLAGGYTLVRPAGDAPAAESHGHLATPAELSAAGLPAGTRAWTNAKGEVGDLPKAISDQLDNAAAALPTPGAPGAAPTSTIGDIPATDRSIVQAIIDGRYPVPTGAAARNPDMVRYLREAAAIDPQFDASNAATRTATRKYFLDGPGAQNITALNTGLLHIAKLQELGDQLHNGQNPMFNAVGNAFDAGVRGHAAVKNFQTQAGIAAHEVARALTGGVPADGDVKRWEVLISDANSPEQIQGVVKTMTEALKARLEQVEEQYRQGMGRSATPLHVLNPDVAAAYSRLQHLGGGASPPPHPAAPAKAGPGGRSQIIGVSG